MNLAEAKAHAITVLTEADIPNPSREADLLLGAVFPRKYVDYEEIFDPEFVSKYLEAVKRRATHEPLSHITGRRAFWNSVFQVNSSVLDPRPDTETLVEHALSVPFDRVLDLGTGSGCIILSLLAEREHASGVATDLSQEALEVAERNANQVELRERVEFIESDWFSQVEGKFDLIVSNPPYISQAAFVELDPTVRDFEPRLALTPGQSGLEAYEAIIPQAREFLTPGGWLMLEIGFDQGRAVERLCEVNGYQDVSIAQDLNRKDRVLRAKLPT